MNMIKSLVAAGLAAATVVATPALAAVSYSNLGTTGLTAPAGTVAYMEAFTPVGVGTFNLSAMTFGVGVAASSAASTQGIYVDFYRNIDLSSTAANALASASYVGGFFGTLTVAANTNTTTAFRAYTFSTLSSLTTPINFVQDGTTNFGVVITLTDSTGQFYSTQLSGLFNTTAPTIGSAYSYVWSDANLNGTFAGSEQTRFGSNSAVYSYLSLTTNAVAAVPEPATWGMMVLGFGLIGGAARRRTVKTTVRFA